MYHQIVLNMMPAIDFQLQYPGVDLKDMPFEFSQGMLLYSPGFMPEVYKKHESVHGLEYVVDQLKHRHADLTKMLKYAAPRRLSQKRVDDIEKSIKDTETRITTVADKIIDPDVIVYHQRCYEAYQWFLTKAEPIIIGSYSDGYPEDD